MEVVQANEHDVPSWLNLVHEVEPLFGPMADFSAPLLRNITRGSAFCVRTMEGVAGGLLLGGSVAEREINWLAVRSAARGRGIGRLLVEEALVRCPPPCRISVYTFGEDNPAGRPARRLYQSFGFVALHLLPNGPEGGTRQRFELVRS